MGERREREWQTRWRKRQKEEIEKDIKKGRRLVRVEKKGRENCGRAERKKLIQEMEKETERIDREGQRNGKKDGKK